MTQTATCTIFPNPKMIQHMPELATLPTRTFSYDYDITDQATVWAAINSLINHICMVEKTENFLNIKMNMPPNLHPHLEAAMTTARNSSWQIHTEHNTRPSADGQSAQVDDGAGVQPDAQAS